MSAARGPQSSTTSGLAPPLLVASISEATSRRGDGVSTNTLRWPLWPHPPSKLLGSSARSAVCASSLACPDTSQATNAPGLSDMDWSMHARRTSHSHASSQQGPQPPFLSRAVVQLVQRGMHVIDASLQASSRPFTSAFTDGLLPAVAYVAIAQHRAVNKFMQRMRHSFARRSHCDDGSNTSNDTHSGSRPYRPALRLYEAAVAKEEQLQPEEAAVLFQQAFDADPRQAEWLSRVAKAVSDQTYLDVSNSVRAADLNSRAIELATRAMGIAPNQAHGYIARCVSRGRLALYSDNRTKVTLAAAAAEDAKTALALEPKNDYAHHLMGRWHYEMASINAVVRTLVRVLFGAALMQGSYTSALEHYRTAASLAPHTLVHRVEVGRTLAKLGHTQEALQELESALHLKVTDLNGHLQKEDAELMVKKLRASPTARQLLFPMVPAQSAQVPAPSATITVIDEAPSGGK